MGFVNSLIVIFNGLIRLLIGVGVVYFLWGVLRYTVVKSDEDKTAAKKMMGWGIVAIFVMVSVWGVVNLLISALGIGGNNVNLPTTQKGPALDNTHLQDLNSWQTHVPDPQLDTHTPTPPPSLPGTGQF